MGARDKLSLRTLLYWEEDVLQFRFSVDVILEAVEG